LCFLDKNLFGRLLPFPCPLMEMPPLLQLLLLLLLSTAAARPV
jgi:hypothetical protein